MRFTLFVIAALLATCGLAFPTNNHPSFPGVVDTAVPGEISPGGTDEYLYEQKSGENDDQDIQKRDSQNGKKQKKKKRNKKVDNNDGDDEIYAEMDKYLKDIAHVPDKIMKAKDPALKHQWLIEQGHEGALHKFLAKYGLPDTGNLDKDLQEGFKRYVAAQGKKKNKKNAHGKTKIISKRAILDRREDPGVDLGPVGNFLVDNQRNMGCAATVLTFMALGTIPVYKAYRFWRLSAADGGIRVTVGKFMNDPWAFLAYYGKGKHRKPYSAGGRHADRGRHAKPLMNKPGKGIIRVGLSLAWLSGEFGVTPQMMVWCFGIRPPF